jgi:hypothetical protein
LIITLAGSKFQRIGFEKKKDGRIPGWKGSANPSASFPWRLIE